MSKRLVLSVGLLGVAWASAWWLGSASPDAATGAAPGAAPDKPAQWIWFPEGDPTKSAPDGDVFFRRVFELPSDAKIKSAELRITADNVFNLFVNGKSLGFNDRWEQLGRYNVAEHLRPGSNVIAVKGNNQGVSPAGLVAWLDVTLADGRTLRVATDGDWKCGRTESKGWQGADFAAEGWAAAKPLGEYGKTGPWLAVEEVAGPAAKKSKKASKNAPPKVPMGNPAERFTVPDGFVVERVADHTLVGSIVRFGFDHKGRPMLSRERGPLLILEAPDEKGVFTKAVVYSDKVKNCQGLFDHVGSVYCVGDGPQGTGLYRQTGEPGATTVELIRKTNGGMGEHGPHQITVGPDGRLWMCLGNHAWLPPYADNSPVRGGYEGQLVPAWNDSRGHAANKRVPGGTILRSAAPAGRVTAETAWTLEAAGFRNQYAFAFNPVGDLFSWDSDMEWDVDLPWYRHTRVTHCPPGAEFGWRTGSGKWPDYSADSLGPVADIGRGSPCGMVFYTHTAFPDQYHGALFITDWSLGRILAVSAKPDGAGYRGAFENFVTGRPLNVTDVDVGPDGNLYFSTGGRNTEGGLFRVRPTQPKRASGGGDFLNLHGLAEALAQNESAWSMARFAQMLREKPEFARLLDDVLAGKEKHLDSEAWLAARIALRAGRAVSENFARQLAGDTASKLNRQVGLQLLGDFESDASRAVLLSALSDADPACRRAALGSLSRHTAVVPLEKLLPLGGDEDRTLRFLAFVAMKRHPAEPLWSAVAAEKSPRAALTAMLALAASCKTDGYAERLVARQTELLSAGGLSDDVLLELTRAASLALLTWDGRLDALNAERSDQLASKPKLKAAAALGEGLLRLFPHKDWRVNREIARVCSYLGTPGTAEKIFAQIKAGAPREQQIHYLYCLRAMGSGWTEATQKAALEWFIAAQSWTGGNSFGGHIEIIFNEWLKHFPAETATSMKAERLARKPKEPERLPVKPAASKYGFDELVLHLTSVKGDAARGQALVEKANCIACHRWGGRGEGAGPDLTDVGRRFQRKDLLESLIYPSKVISDQYKGWIWLLSDDRVVTGVIATQDDATITVIQSDTKKVVLQKADIAQTKPAPHSIMPEGLLNPFTPEQIADLFAALEVGPPRPTP